MKKSLVALAALAASAAFAQTTTGAPGFQIQGNVNAGFGSLSYKGVKINGIEQNGAGTTQINFRGLENLGGGNQAYFRVENDVSIVRNDANQGVITDVGNAWTNNNVTVTAAGTNTTLSSSGSPSTQQQAQNYTAVRTQKGATSTFGNGELIVGARGAWGNAAFGAINNAGLLNFVLIASPIQGTSYGGGYGSIIGADPTLGAVRWNNSFRYITPNLAGFEAQVIYSAKQTNQANTFATSGIAATTVNTGLGQNDQIGATEIGLKYANGPLTLGFVNTNTDSVGASFCSAISSTASTLLSAGKNQPCYLASAAAGSFGTKGVTINKGFKSVQNSLAAKYDLPGGFTLSGGLQSTQWKEIVAGDGNQVDRKASMVTLSYVTGAHTMFGSMGTSKESATNNLFNGQTTKMTGLGYNYALSKTTAIFARHEALDDKAGTIASSYGDSINLLGTDTTQKRVRQQVGLIVNF